MARPELDMGHKSNLPIATFLGRRCDSFGRFEQRNTWPNLWFHGLALA